MGGQSAALRAAKSGLARIAAAAAARPSGGPGPASGASGLATTLTEIAHRNPSRVIPMGPSAVGRAGAALAAISSYGGGMVRGDRQDLTLEVGAGARLGVVTQGATRVYRREGRLGGQEGQEEGACEATLDAAVGEGGFLVWAPDPLVPYSGSALVQRQAVRLGQGASLVMVDWFGAGRVSSGERWDFDLLASRTDLTEEGAGGGGGGGGPPVPFLVEAMRLDRQRASGGDPFGFHPGPGARFDAFASVVLHGPGADGVARRFEALAAALAAERTRVREGAGSAGKEEEGDAALTGIATEGTVLDPGASLGGRALIGVSRVERGGGGDGDGGGGGGGTYVARLATGSNEDMYRILHSCLLPLRHSFGVEFYRDRIHGATPLRQIEGGRPGGGGAPLGASRPVRPPPRGEVAPPPAAAGPVPGDRASWCALMLADSGLPTGSFAHSAGIEAAAQLGLLGPRPNQPDAASVRSYVAAASRSAAQSLAPFVAAGADVLLSSSGDGGEDVDRMLEEWSRLDRYAHATLAANGPGCRASLDQGHGLLRVAIQWIEGAAAGASPLLELLRRIQAKIERSSSTTGHVGPIFGLAGAHLGLSADATVRVVGYCAARDMVSAAVRLNLVGPMAGVSLLDRTQGAVDEGIRVALEEMPSRSAADPLAMVRNAATCSPIVEAVHPTHDMLALRLFRT